MVNSDGDDYKLHSANFTSEAVHPCNYMLAGQEKDIFTQLFTRGKCSHVKLILMYPSSNMSIKSASYELNHIWMFVDFFFF